jgi:hypothetical protein
MSQLDSAADEAIAEYSEAKKALGVESRRIMQARGPPPLAGCPAGWLLCWCCCRCRWVGWGALRCGCSAGWCGRGRAPGSCPAPLICLCLPVLGRRWCCGRITACSSCAPGGWCRSRTARCAPDG